MAKFKKYGKWFLIAAAGCGVVLFAILAALGLPIWLAFILGVIGAIPAAIALAVAGALAWADVMPEDRTLERIEREEQARQGRDVLDRAKRGDPRRGI